MIIPTGIALDQLPWGEDPKSGIQVELSSVIWGLLPRFFRRQERGSVPPPDVPQGEGGEQGGASICSAREEGVIA